MKGDRSQPMLYLIYCAGRKMYFTSENVQFRAEQGESRMFVLWGEMQVRVLVLFCSTAVFSWRNVRAELDVGCAHVLFHHWSSPPGRPGFLHQFRRPCFVLCIYSRTGHRNFLRKNKGCVLFDLIYHAWTLSLRENF